LNTRLIGEPVSRPLILSQVELPHFAGSLRWRRKLSAADSI
jgi:hypothetical protein